MSESTETNATVAVSALSAGDGDDPGREALVYNPSSVSWAVSESVARPPALLSRMVLYSILGVLVAGGVFSYFATVAVTVSGRGIVRTSGKIRPVRAQVTGKVAELLVKNGKRIKKGDALIEMENVISAQELERIQSLLGRLRKVVGSGDSRTAMAEAQVLGQELLRLTGPVLTSERAALTEATSAYERALRQLHDTVPELSRADLTEREMATAKIAKIKKERLETELASDLAELERTVARLNVALRDRREQALRQLATARSTLEVQVNSFAEALRVQVGSLRILSPVDGVVSNLAVSGVGELITSGQTLFEVIPEGGQLIGEIQIANKDIAQLRVGLPVRLKLDAFPYQDYGFVSGSVLELPQDVTRSEKGAPPTYQVLVSLDRTVLDGSHGRGNVLLGMTFDADIQIRRRTLLQMAVVEMLKLKDLF